jgi:hypothetical protein
VFTVLLVGATLPVLAGCGAGGGPDGTPTTGALATSAASTTSAGASRSTSHDASQDASQDASPVARRGLRAPGKAPEVPPVAPEGDTHGRLGAADGEVPEGVTAFDDYPAVDNLDPALLRALRAASARARADRVEVYVTSGWRSRAYQERLLDDAVARYGSRAEAARWVSTPATSAHVSGHAVDVGRSDAAAWLADHGAPFGLCQVYDNEPWHYELRPDAARDGCPARYADPTQDPRNRR